jgi:hypothetical protein
VRGRFLLGSTLVVFAIAAAVLSAGQTATAGQRALPKLPACHPTTHIYPSLAAGPAGTQISLSFSSDPNPAFDGFTLYAGGRPVEEGGGYPGLRPLKVLLTGAVGQKEAFVLVRDYLNGGNDAPSCVSARALVKITSRAVKRNPPPPPATPSLPRCPTQIAATLTPSRGPSGTQTTLRFTQPAERWDGFQLYVSSGDGGYDGGGFPGSYEFVAKGEHGQKIAYTLARDYLNGSIIEPTCIAAQVMFTIS